MGNSKTILVTGATGRQGGAVARELLSHGFKIKAFTRNPDGEQAKELKKLGAEIVKGDYDDPSSMEKAMKGVDVVEVIGMKHELFDEGIFAFVRPSAGVTLNSEDVMEHCKAIASYKRPQHVEMWPSDREFPLTRSTKVDKLKLVEIAGPIVDNLRQTGKWDAKEE